MDQNNKRIALVTGATGGLGTAMCEQLVRDGYHVVGNYRSKQKADEWMADMKQKGFVIELYEGDVCSFDSMGDMIQKIETDLGPIDILVNNAGITKDGRFC